MIPVRKVGGRIHWAEYNPRAGAAALRTLCGQRIPFVHRAGKASGLISYYRFAEPEAVANCGHCVRIAGRDKARRTAPTGALSQ